MAKYNKNSNVNNLNVNIKYLNGKKGKMYKSNDKKEK
jgi:hypothetical protein